MPTTHPVQWTLHPAKTGNSLSLILYAFALTSFLKINQKDVDKLKAGCYNMQHKQDDY